MANAQMDREKFKIFERNERTGAMVQAQQKSAEEKEDAAGNQMDGNTPMWDMQARLGRMIQVGKFIEILKRLNVNLIFQISNGDPTKYGIYMPHYEMDLKTSVPVLAKEPRFITGMESGINIGGRINEGMMPEFSITLTKDDVGLRGNAVKKVRKFEREIRGWRTVLAALYTEGLITEAQIEANFKISQGRDSSNWRNRINPGITVSGG